MNCDALLSENLNVEFYVLVSFSILKLYTEYGKQL